MHEKSRLPHSGETFKAGVEGMRIETVTLRSYENDRSRTSNEIHKGSRTSIEIDRLRTSRLRDETEKPDSQNSEYTVSNELGSRKTWRCT